MFSTFVALIGVAATVFFLVGSVFGWIALNKNRKLEKELARLSHQVAELKRSILQLERKKRQVTPKRETTVAQKTSPPTPFPKTASTKNHQPTEENITPDDRPATAGRLTSKQQPVPKLSPRVTYPSHSAPTWLVSLKDNWMIWLGGICVGLAGVFLAKYSIEKGLLGPGQRIALACLLGVGLHGLAEFLRRKANENHPAFAALAGGASIVIYAAMIAALHLYGLLDNTIVFAILAAVSLFTMLIALYYGPVLVILGILGAYLVPILVSSDSGNILAALVYSLIICSSALALMRFVYRSWIWYGALLGALAWWALSCATPDADGFRGIYLAILCYLILAVPIFDWLLSKTVDEGDPGCEAFLLQYSGLNFKIRPIQISLTLILIAQAFTICLESFSPQAWLSFSPLLIIILLACKEKTPISSLLWPSLALQWLAWLYGGFEISVAKPLSFNSLPAPVHKDFLLFTAIMTGLYSGLSWFTNKDKPYSDKISSLINLAPILWFLLAYLLVTDLTVNLYWGFWSLVLAIFYLVTATIRLERNWGVGGSVWMILAGHFSLSLAMVMFFREATLTLALSTQLISLALINRRFVVPGLKWIMKAILFLVVIRLTANPLLLTYPTDIHWSLYTYGGAALCSAIAAWIARDEEDIAKWLEAASLHLFVLFLFTELRYWLYSGNIFHQAYGLKEASINTGLWAFLGLVYYHRSKIATTMSPFYLGCSKLLLLLAFLNYLLVLTVLNPLWSGEKVGEQPLANILLLAYGLPVLAAYLVYYCYQGQLRKFAAWTAASGFLFFISIEIRQLWHSATDLGLDFKDGELYTYSIVWLAIAVLSILLAAVKGWQEAYKAAMAFLLLVIAKIFIIDMADLEGLLRVASFMGLGLSLLGLAYLHQKITRLNAEK